MIKMFTRKHFVPSRGQITLDKLYVCIFQLEATTRDVLWPSVSKEVSPSAGEKVEM